MEDNFGFLWTYQENIDELKQKLHCVTYELEMSRKETNEVITKNNDQIKKLLLMLQAVSKERDEANSQLTSLQQQMLLFHNKTQRFDQLMPIPTNNTFACTPFSPDSPLITATFPTPITHSGITESTYVSSPATVSSSPDSNNICFVNTAAAAGSSRKGVDRATMLMEKLAKGRPRPRQGKMLQAIVEAGPLLQTIMVAGSLPEWRNPPGQMRPIPPIQLSNGYGKRVVFGESSDGSMRITPVLDFGATSMPKRRRLL